MFSRFDTKHACDRDGQTDGIAVAYALCHAVARNNNPASVHHEKEQKRGYYINMNNILEAVNSAENVKSI